MELIKLLSFFSSNANILVLLADSNSKLLWVNKAFENHGYHKSRIIGKKCMSVFNSTSHFYSNSLLRKALNTGKCILTQKKDFKIIVHPFSRNGKVTHILYMAESFKEPIPDSTEFCRKIYEESPLGICMVDLDFNFTDVNKAFCDMLGYSKKDLINHNLEMVTHHDYIDANKDNLRKLIHGRIKKYSTEKQYVKKNKQLVWGSVIAFSIHDSHGKILSILAIVLDITDRKLMEQKLTSSNQKFETLFDNMDNCVAVYKAVKGGKDFTIVNFNKSAERTERVNRADILGKPLTKVFTGVKKFGLLNALQDVNRTGKPKRLPIALYKDKRIQSWRENYVYKLPSCEIVVIYQDVTAREKVAEELNKMSRFPDENPNPVLRMSLDGKILYKNRASLKLLPFFADPSRTKGSDYVKLIIRKCLQQDKKIDIQMEEEDKLYQLFFTPYKKNDYVNVYAIDISKLKNAEQKIADSSEFLDKIINSISDPVFVKDRDHRFILVNDAYCTFTGQKRADTIGKDDFDFFPKEQVEVFLKKDERVFSTGKMDINEEEITDSGGIKHAILTKKSLYTDKYQNKFIVGIIMDISDRKLAEQRIKENEQQLQTIFDNLPLGIATNKISTGKTIQVNAKFEKIYGWPKEELQDVDSFFRKVYPDVKLRKELHERVFSDIGSGDISRMSWENLKITTKTNEEKVIDASNIPLPSMDLMVSTVTDVTEKFRIQQDRENLTKQLQVRIDELERFQKLTLGRELKMIELKNRIKELEQEIAKGGQKNE